MKYDKISDQRIFPKIFSFSLILLLLLCIIVAGCDVINQKGIMVNATLDENSNESQDLINDTFDDTRTIVEEWIFASPTYGYDGQDIAYIDYKQLGAAEYLMRYSYTSTHSGYGDRTYMMASDILTQHVITVDIKGRKIVSAIIDNRWDEMNQKMLSDIVDNALNNTDNNQDLVKLEYVPMQCITTPWNAWLANSSIRFIKAPSEQEVMTMYYANQSIALYDYQEIKTSGVVCTVCYSCATGYKYLVSVDRPDIQAMLYTGWKEI